jgi:hypothetical protein
VIQCRKIAIPDEMKVWNQKKMKISLKRGIPPSPGALKNGGV